MRTVLRAADARFTASRTRREGRTAGNPTLTPQGTRCIVVVMTLDTNHRALGLSLVALACWVMLLAAGTDVWHDAGRPDIFARLSERGATLFDLRACAYAFYGLFVVLSVQVVLTGFAIARRR